MDSLFHFIFPLLALMAARVRFKKHTVPMMIGLALAAVMLDLDHFFGMVPRGTFHNVFVTVIIPVAFLAYSFRYGVEAHRQTSIALLIVMTSHIVLDMFSEGAVYLLYPFSAQTFSLAVFALVTPQGYYLLSSSSVGLLVYFVMLSGCFFLEEIDLFVLKKHINFRYAMKYAFRKEEKELLN